MMGLRTAGLALTLLLLSCSTQPKTDSLESRARAGDVSAACDLVLRDLQQCASARKDWIGQPSSPRPRCMDDPVPADHQQYFSQAIETLEGPPERRELLAIISDGVAVTEAGFKRNMSAPESLIDIIDQSCATLRG
ncbi:MAG TPA: hypothetical protein VJ822_17985 [Dongiaceae bacterium]|nr:hypothetical protein [Dongiaceae bacterium]